MRSLYLRIWLTVVVALALFAGVSGWLVQRHVEEQRRVAEAATRERLEAWADLLERSLPPPQAPAAEQTAALRDWSQRLRVPMALHAADGARIGASDSYLRREAEFPGFAARTLPLRFDDGRTLYVARPGWRPMGPPGAQGPGGPPGPRMGPGMGPAGGPGAGLPRVVQDPRAWPWMPRGWPDGLGLVLLLVVLFVAVAGGAYPVVRRLTKRLEALQQGVEAFGAGDLHRRVPEEGRDEVARVAASFNQAAARIEALLRSHQSLLANASHELRSPLARLKMALAMLDEATPEQRTRLQAEVAANIAELDQLIDEVLLASRLDAQAGGADAAAQSARQPVELLGLAAEEAARTGAEVSGDEVSVLGDERLLRRALRNLLENARRYGGDGPGGSEVHVEPHGVAGVRITVSDRGPGVPEAYRERIFEPYFRLPGHAERAGGVGLGLSLVRQIAQRHGGQVVCQPREGGGSRFVLTLPGA